MSGSLLKLGFTKLASIRYRPTPTGIRQDFKKQLESQYKPKPKPPPKDSMDTLRRKVNPRESIHIPGLTKKKKFNQQPSAPDSLKKLKLTFDKFKDSTTGKFLQGVADKKFMIPLNKEKKTSLTFGQLGKDKASDKLPPDIKLQRQHAGLLKDEKSYPRYGITFTKRF